MAGSATNVDLSSTLTYAASIVPVIPSAATTNGTGVDLAGHESAMAVAGTGALTGGTVAFTIEDSDDDAVADPYVTIAAADLNGAFVSTSASARTETVGIVRCKRWVRIVATEGGTVSAGACYGNIVSNASRHL